MFLGPTKGVTSTPFGGNKAAVASRRKRDRLGRRQNGTRSGVVFSKRGSPTNLVASFATTWRSIDKFTKCDLINLFRCCAWSLDETFCYLVGRSSNQTSAMLRQQRCWLCLRRMATTTFTSYLRSIRTKKLVELIDSSHCVVFDENGRRTNQTQRRNRCFAIYHQK